MKKPSSKIREEIARLQDQLRQAETREAERIGRIALKAGLGEIEIDETALQLAFEDMAKRFCGRGAVSNGKARGGAGSKAPASTAPIAAGATERNDSEA